MWRRADRNSDIGLKTAPVHFLYRLKAFKNEGFRKGLTTPYLYVTFKGIFGRCSECFLFVPHGTISKGEIMSNKKTEAKTVRQSGKAKMVELVLSQNQSRWSDKELSYMEGWLKDKATERALKNLFS